MCHNDKNKSNTASSQHKKPIIEKPIQRKTFSAGDKVDALYLNGFIHGWFPATIEKENEDGTFQIKWDDGETIDRRHKR